MKSRPFKRVLCILLGMNHCDVGDVALSLHALILQVVYNGLAWVAVGFSSDGEMVGSDAVIGLPDVESAAEYDLDGQVAPERFAYGKAQNPGDATLQLSFLPGEHSPN